MPTVVGIEEGSHGAEVRAEKKGKLWKDRKTFSRTYLVIADTVDDTEASITSTTGIPPKWYPLNGCYCIGHHPKERNTVVHPVSGALTVLWEVGVDFDSDVDPDEDADPESRPPKWRWYGETEEETLERDAITGAPIQTAAEERIIVTGPIVVPVLEIRRWELSPFDPTTMLLYSNRTNTTAFWGAPAGMALLHPMEVGEYELIPVDGVNVKYVQVTYKISFKIRPDPDNPGQLLQNPWAARVMHHGYKYRVEDEYSYELSRPKIHLDVNGKPSTVNLNSDGTENTSDEPDWLTFNRFGQANLNALSLGPF